MSVLAIAILLFAFGLTAAVAAGEPLAFDRNIMLALRRPANPSIPIGPPWLREVARDITSLGSTTVLGIVTCTVVGYLILIRKPAVAGLMLVAVLGGLVVNNLLKFAFARPRPNFVAHVREMYTKSFPSGHAALSAIIYLTMGALLARTYPSFAIGLLFISLAAFLTIIIGLSRVYLGYHYPTDVLGGWCFGAAWAMGCWLLMAWVPLNGRFELSIAH
jgi:undecaprenyl-diphosphatase